MESKPAESPNTPSRKNLRVGLASASTLGGFMYSMSLARKVDPVAFSKGLQLINTNVTKRRGRESGFMLALRAFGCASLITVTSIGCLSTAVWIYLGAPGWKDFNRRLSNLFPASWRLKPTDPSTNFKTFEEIYDYITSADPVAVTDQSYKSTKNK